MSVPPDPPAAEYPPPPAPVPPPMPYQYAPATRTNGFAIASLVCSIATVVFCGIGTVLGIVFGHVARHQIKRTGEGGGGLALAGLIIGYACVAIAVLVIGSIVILTAVVDHSSAGVDHARDVNLSIVRLAKFRDTTPRDRTIIDQAFSANCCDTAVTLGSTGIPLVVATNADLARVGWRIDIDGPFDEHACLTVPSEAVALDRDVRSGRC